ncbi:hypothetical protein ANRL4_05179 [Anaerolineae bacterium]|nr:hypothetical protein ANRL4_05179 [Anaerolineae bacterium]
MAQRHNLYPALIIFCAALLTLSACQSDPVVLVATPIPPDANFRGYRHPTGAFTLRLPSDWVVRDVSYGGVVHVEFSAPNATGLPLSIYVINTGAAVSASALLDSMDRFQLLINGNPLIYDEMSRNAQGDGSWRVVGVRQTPIGARQLNTFFQANGPLLAAMEADITNLNADQLQVLRAVINTLRLDPAAVIAPSSIQAIAESGGSEASNTAAGVLTFSGLYAWTTPQGEFVVNGQVSNASGAPLEAIRVTAILYDAAGAVLEEASNIVPVEVLLDTATAPFSIRFREGKPSQTVRYELQGAARYAEYALQSYLGDDQFIRGNDQALYNANGYLTVSGDVVNRAQQPAYFVKAVVTVFDEGSRVVAADTVFLNKSTLLPGEVSRFEVTFPELGGSAIRYVITIEGKSVQ